TRLLPPTWSRICTIQTWVQTRSVCLVALLAPLQKHHPPPRSATSNMQTFRWIPNRVSCASPDHWTLSALRCTTFQCWPPIEVSVRSTVRCDRWFDRWQDKGYEHCR